MIYLNPRYYLKYRSAPYNFNEVETFMSSMDNYFVPLFAGLDGKLLMSESGKKSLMYNIRTSKSNQVIDIPKTTTKFMSFFHEGMYPYAGYKDYDSGITYSSMKHLIYVMREGNPVVLYALCMSRDEIFKVTPHTFESNPVYNNMFALISNELSNDIHKKMYSKLKLLTKHLGSLGVNIMFSDDVNKLCLKKVQPIDRFNTIDEKVDFINQIKKQAGLNEPVKQEPAPPVPEPFNTIQYEPQITSVWNPEGRVVSGDYSTTFGVTTNATGEYVTVPAGDMSSPPREHFLTSTDLGF